MENLPLFRLAGPSPEDTAEALEALGVRLDPQDQSKVADNIALLGRHWRIVTEYAAPDRNDR